MKVALQKLATIRSHLLYEMENWVYIYLAIYLAPALSPQIMETRTPPFKPQIMYHNSIYPPIPPASNTEHLSQMILAYFRLNASVEVSLSLNTIIES
jgi:hypothetical protein